MLQLPLGRSLSPSAVFISSEEDGGPQERQFLGNWVWCAGIEQSEHSNTLQS